jgi:hypothetical protein
MQVGLTPLAAATGPHARSRTKEITSMKLP